MYTKTVKLLKSQDLHSEIYRQEGIIMELIKNIILFYVEIHRAIFNFYIENSRTILDYMHIFFNKLFYVVLYITIFFTLAYLVMGIILLIKKRRIKEKTVSKSKLPFVTIQIPTYNELAAINCAKKCLEFDYPKEKFMILIGDDSSGKEISKQIDRFAKNHKQIKVTRRGTNKGFKPGNLNHMLKHTKGEYIVIFDSDFLPEKDFLKRIMAPFVHDKNVSAVQARWVTKNIKQNLVSLLGGTIPLLTHHLGLPFLNLINGNTFIAGSAEAIRKKDLIKLGGWKSGALTEDIEYSLRLTNTGKKIVYLDKLHCKCEAPFTLNDLGKQQMRWAYGVITASKMHFKDIWKNKKITVNNKFNIFLLLSGYMVTFLFFTLTLLGFFSIITHRPESINWLKFISETTFHIVVTSGFLATLVITFFVAKKAREIPKMIFASFTIGLVVVSIVTLGIFKAIFNRPMKWYMLEKKGNEIQV